MEFRRSGQRDERRRRVLMDEMRAPSADSPASSEGTAGRESRGSGYAAAARETHQPPVTTLIPKRWWTICVAGLMGLVAIAAIETLYTNVFQVSPPLRQSGLGALDVTAASSLAVWFQSTVLLAAAAMAVLVYHLRRHKVDDYHGRYRCWIWCSAALVLASLDLVAGLHRTVESEMLVAAGAWGPPGIWWLSTLGGLYLLVGIRMLVEMRRCRVAAVLLCLAAGGYALAAGWMAEIVFLNSTLLNAMGASTSLLLATLMTALAVAVYSRHVYLEAQGLLPTRRPGDSAQQPAKPDRAKSETAKQAQRPPVVKRRPTIRVDQGHDRASDQPAGPEVAEEVALNGGKLSKAERRRLRKQARRQRSDTGP